MFDPPRIAQRLAAVASSMLCCAALLAACTPGADPPATSVPHPTANTAPTPPPTQAQAAARMQQCRAGLEAAIPSGLVSNASVDNGRPILWVGAAWRGSAPAAKEAVVRDAACFFLSGDESRTLQFSVYEQATDTELAVWNRTHLVLP